MHRAATVVGHLSMAAAAAPGAKRRSPVTTHVLDTHRGRPGANIAVSLAKLAAGGSWVSIGKGVTDADGRCGTLISDPDSFEAGTYRIEFGVEEYYTSRGEQGFYPSVQITFTVRNAAEHYHVPLLLSAHGYSTYRGS